MDSSKHYPTLIQNVHKEDEITECYSVTGEGSHLIKAVVSDTSALEKLLARIQSWTGVTGTQTSIVLSEIKKSHCINSQKVLESLEHSKNNSI
jgi:Lrp/AsnC family leucine-responsive transcriptional regulator